MSSATVQIATAKGVEAENLNAFAFLELFGRFPRLGDVTPPWRRKGWLLLYVVEANRVHPTLPDRYGYHLRNFTANELPGADSPYAPIPQIHFVGEFSPETKAGMRDLSKWLEIIERRHGSWDSFRVFVDWLAFALAVAQEPSPLDDGIQEQLYRAVNLQNWLLTPSDYLGAFLSERKAKGWNPDGFYPTPHNVVEFMVNILLDEGVDHRMETVCDPAVGTGRMLLHASNHSLRLYGVDINPMVVKMCQINGALYAPWMAFPLPERLFEQPSPPPPPEPLPVEYAPPPEVETLRVDDLGQGLLFHDFAPAKKKRR